MRLLSRHQFILALITLAALYVRLKGTLDGFFAFTYDQGRDMLAVYDLVKTGKLGLIGPTTGLPGVFYGPWWYWFLTPSFVLSAGSPTVQVILITVVNTLMVPLSFILGKRVGGTVIGYITCLMFALSPPLISVSAQLWNPNLAPFFTLLALFYFWRLLERHDKTSIILLGLSGGAVLEFAAAFGIAFVLATTICLLLLRFLGRIRLTLVHFAAFFFGILFFLLPRIVFEFRHDFLMSRSAYLYLASPTVFQTPLTLMERFQDRLSQFFSFFTKTLVGENAIIGALVGFIFFITLWIFFKSKEHKSMKTYAFSLIFIILMMYILFTLYKDAVWGYYLIGLPVIYIILASLILFQLKKTNIKLFTIFALFILYFAIQPLRLVHSLFTEWEGDESVYRNQLRTVDAVYQTANGLDFSVEVYTPAVVDYPYQYHFRWYGQKKYGYQPSQGRSTVFYILEPGNRALQKHWLDIRKDDGIIIKEENLPGAITIQQRRR